MVYGWYLGKAWVDRWLRRRKVERRAQTLTLTVQQKSCHQSESILLGSSLYDSTSGLEAVWEKASLYLTRIGWAALVSSAQANMVQLVLNAKKQCAWMQEQYSVPQPWQQGRRLLWLATSLWRALGMCSTSFLGEVRAPWHLWVLPLWASHRQIISDYSYKL